MLARFISASHAALLYARFLGWRTLLPEKTPELDRYEGIGNHRDETGSKAVEPAVWVIVQNALKE
jgi:hypothetical protein